MLLATALLAVLAASARAACLPPGVDTGYILPYPGAPLPFNGALDQRYLFSALQALNFQVQALQRQQVLLLTSLRCANISVTPNEACRNPPFEPLPTTNPTTTTTEPTTTTTAHAEFNVEGENTADVYPPEVPYPLYVDNKEYDLYISPEELNVPSGLQLDIKVPAFDLFGRLGRDADTEPGTQSGRLVNGPQILAQRRASNPRPVLQEESSVSSVEVDAEAENSPNTSEVRVEVDNSASSSEADVEVEEPDVVEKRKL